MQDASVIVRSLNRGDGCDVAEICYRTGYHGEDLSGSGRFNDRKLFAMLFAEYYVRWEPGHCFVAVDTTSGRAVGYILGALDTIRQERGFSRRMVPRIACRALFHTFWRHRESFRALLHFNRVDRNKPSLGAIHRAYPAHLHINVLPEYQRRGLGGLLLESFERHARREGPVGVHLITSERNTTALPFYGKHGYRVETAVLPGLWPDSPAVRGLVFVRSL
jgi:GNAT superfamily N-acetyltransferase